MKIMLTLTAKLSELNEDGLKIARLLENDNMPTIQGSTVFINKFSSVSMRSIISYEERYRKFNSDGEPRRKPLDEWEEKHLETRLRVYGNSDKTLFGFYPVVELYKRGNRCLGCIQKFKSRYDKPDHDHRNN